jgi:hypothetical protein
VRSRPGSFIADLPSNFSADTALHGNDESAVTPASNGRSLTMPERRTRAASRAPDTASISAPANGSCNCSRALARTHSSNRRFGARCAFSMRARSDVRSASSSSQRGRSRSAGTTTIGGGSGRLLSMMRSVVLLKNASSA